MRKPVFPRVAARRDVEEALDYDVAEAGAQTALRFIDAVAATYAALADYPMAASPRVGQELDLPGLRSRRVDGFPYLVFYVEKADRIDVWRVLHGQRGMAAWLGVSGD